jgi:hypothetical protein
MVGLRSLDVFFYFVSRSRVPIGQGDNIAARILSSGRQRSHNECRLACSHRLRVRPKVGLLSQVGFFLSLEVGPGNFDIEGFISGRVDPFGIRLGGGQRPPIDDRTQ